jgi:DNA-binding HxlR family transcriptional regulator
MLRRTYEGQNCSIARALELVGERWTLLIIRDALLGLRRFDEFQQSLGIARNVLAERLNRLVAEGILERRLYSERPQRFEYVLTPKGHELNIPVLALMQWGDRHLSEKPPRIARRRSDRRKVRAALVGPEDTLVRQEEIEVVDGPGLGAGTH